MLKIDSITSHLPVTRELAHDRNSLRADILESKEEIQSIKRARRLVAKYNLRDNDKGDAKCNGVELR